MQVHTFMGQYKFIYSLVNTSIYTHWSIQVYILIGQYKFIYSLVNTSLYTHWSYDKMVWGSILFRLCLEQSKITSKGLQRSQTYIFFSDF